MDRNDNIKSYYSLRSEDYDTLYERPDRLVDLAGMLSVVREKLQGRRILEIACGTGYWTELLADCVESIQCIDTSPEMLEIARKRTESKRNVTFSINDAYRLDEVKGTYNAAFLGYWISHVPRNRMRDFLVTVEEKLEESSVIVMLDNRYVDGTTPISHEDKDGNTYQLRKLRNGSIFEILKNFLRSDELMKLVGGNARNIEYSEFVHYWVFSYIANSATRRHSGRRDHSGT